MSRERFFTPKLLPFRTDTARSHLSTLSFQTLFEGSAGWLVKNLSLYQTVVTWAPTQERASLCNGSLASSRIINWGQSPQAQFHIFLNFPIETPYDKVLIFKGAVEEYMKVHPHEWLSLNGFRANWIFLEKDYVEYIIVIQHRDSWQMIGQVLDSKANLSSYCMEVVKQLGMNYWVPPLPIDLTYSNAIPVLEEPVNTTRDPKQPNIPREDIDNEARIQSFRSIVNKHNIQVC